MRVVTMVDGKRNVSRLEFSVRNVRYRLLGVQYQLESPDGTTYGKGTWVSERELRRI